MIDQKKIMAKIFSKGENITRIFGIISKILIDWLEENLWEKIRKDMRKKTSEKKDWRSFEWNQRKDFNEERSFEERQKRYENEERSFVIRRR